MILPGEMREILNSVPVLMRLKELEALEKVAEKIDKLRSSVASMAC